MRTAVKDKLLSSTLKSEKGIALILVVMVTALLFPLLFSGVRSSGLNLQVASNLKVGGVTLQVADTGIQHALAVIPSGGNFTYSSSTTIVPTGGSGTVAHPTLSGYSYSVTAINTAGGAQAIITSTANGPNSTKKVITAYVGRTNGGLCAICLPGSFDEAETNFSGNLFTISGFDTALGSSACATSGSSVPAIGVTDQNLVSEITSTLDVNQRSRVMGSGGTPSVKVVPPMSTTVSQIADAYIALIPPSCTECVIAGGTITSGTLGTDVAPRITRITGNATLSGTVSGSGVLIVDGDITVTDNFTFNGLVVARGEVEVAIFGSASIFGGLMIGGVGPGVDVEVELDMRGSAKVCYSTQGLAKADAVGPNVRPTPTKLVAWHEKLG